MGFFKSKNKQNKEQLEHKCGQKQGLSRDAVCRDRKSATSLSARVEAGSVSGDTYCNIESGSSAGSLADSGVTFQSNHTFVKGDTPDRTQSPRMEVISEKNTVGHDHDSERKRNIIRHGRKVSELCPRSSSGNSHSLRRNSRSNSVPSKSNEELDEKLSSKGGANDRLTGKGKFWNKENLNSWLSKRDTKGSGKSSRVSSKNCSRNGSRESLKSRSYERLNGNDFLGSKKKSGSFTELRQPKYTPILFSARHNIHASSPKPSASGVAGDGTCVVNVEGTSLNRKGFMSLTPQHRTNVQSSEGSLAMNRKGTGLNIDLSCLGTRFRRTPPAKSSPKDNSGSLHSTKLGVRSRANSRETRPISFNGQVDLPASSEEKKIKEQAKGTRTLLGRTSSDVQSSPLLLRKKSSSLSSLVLNSNIIKVHMSRTEICAVIAVCGTSLQAALEYTFGPSMLEDNTVINNNSEFKFPIDVKQDIGDLCCVDLCFENNNSFSGCTSKSSLLKEHPEVTKVYIHKWDLSMVTLYCLPGATAKDVITATFTDVNTDDRYEVCNSGDDLPVNLDQDISVLNGQSIYIRKRFCSSPRQASMVDSLPNSFTTPQPTLKGKHGKTQHMSLRIKSHVKNKRSLDLLGDLNISSADDTKSCSILSQDGESERAASIHDSDYDRFSDALLSPKGELFSPRNERSRDFRGSVSNSLQRDGQSTTDPEILDCIRDLKSKIRKTASSNLILQNKVDSFIASQTNISTSYEFALTKIFELQRENTVLQKAMKEMQATVQDIQDSYAVEKDRLSKFEQTLDSTYLKKNESSRFSMNFLWIFLAWVLGMISLFASYGTGTYKKLKSTLCAGKKTVKTVNALPNKEIRKSTSTCTE
eukprot:Nk52_evm16s372 gene=Nk52_evmTU16s372